MIAGVVRFVLDFYLFQGRRAVAGCVSAYKSMTTFLARAAAGMVDAVKAGAGVMTQTRVQSAVQQQKATETTAAEKTTGADAKVDDDEGLLTLLSCLCPASLPAVVQCVLPTFQ